MKPPPNGMKRRDTYFNKMIAVKGKNSICVIKSVALHLLRLIKKKTWLLITVNLLQDIDSYGCSKSIFHIKPNPWSIYFRLFVAFLCNDKLHRKKTDSINI